MDTWILISAELFSFCLGSAVRTWNVILSKSLYDEHDDMLSFTDSEPKATYLVKTP
jgi:hypothetical protein